MTTPDNPTPPIKVYRKIGQPVRIKVRPDRSKPGLYINAGPLQGTLPPADAIRLATRIIDALEEAKDTHND